MVNNANFQVDAYKIAFTTTDGTKLSETTVDSTDNTSYYSSYITWYVLDKDGSGFKGSVDNGETLYLKAGTYNILGKGSKYLFGANRTFSVSVSPLVVSAAASLSVTPAYDAFTITDVALNTPFALSSGVVYKVVIPSAGTYYLNSATYTQVYYQKDGAETSYSSSRSVWDDEDNALTLEAGTYYFGLNEDYSASASFGIYTTQQHSTTSY